MHELDSSPRPPTAERDKVVRILERFKKLSLVPQLAQDVNVYKWPSSAQVIGDPRGVMAFPHRVWVIPQGPTRPGRALAPVELMFLPLIIQKYEDRRDGDLLEIIQQCRELVSVTFPSEIKDNSKVWNAMRNFLK
jgi:hypothetical protein